MRSPWLSSPREVMIVANKAPHGERLWSVERNGERVHEWMARTRPIARYD